MCFLFQPAQRPAGSPPVRPSHPPAASAGGAGFFTGRFSSSRVPKVFPAGRPDSLSHRSRLRSLRSAACGFARSGSRNFRQPPMVLPRRGPGSPRSGPPWGQVEGPQPQGQRNQLTCTTTSANRGGGKSDITASSSARRAGRGHHLGHQLGHPPLRSRSHGCLAAAEAACCFVCDARSATPRPHARVDKPR